jgi:DNA topoisomerase I
MTSVDSSVEPEKAAAREAGLRYVSDDEPGIRRGRAGRGFSYRLPDGGLVKDSDVLQRIRSLAIPPAWRDVWICVRANGHLQATGRDDKGRKQYRYHTQWREIRDLDKFEHVLEFAKRLPRVRARIEKDLRRRGMAREKVLATVVSLLDKTLIRVGNDEYAKDNGSYGLTTLRPRHLTVEGSELRFHFKGKSGKVWKLKVRDRRIARVVKNCQELPGQQLFQYPDDDGLLRAISSADVNDYLREITDYDVSTKDFRTWAGTVLGALALSAVGPFDTKAQAKGNVRRAIEAVAARLGNTPTVCRKCYVHPEIVACYLEGVLPTIAAEEGDRETDLPTEEAAVLRLLKRRLTGASSGTRLEARAAA